MPKTVARVTVRLSPLKRGSGPKDRGGSENVRRQHPIGPCFADYYCAALKLAIEVDGDWHDTVKDRARDTFFMNKGVITHRISIHDVDENIEGALQAIDSVIAGRKLELNIES